MWQQFSLKIFKCFLVSCFQQFDYSVTKCGILLTLSIWSSVGSCTWMPSSFGRLGCLLLWLHLTSFLPPHSSPFWWCPESLQCSHHCFFSLFLYESEIFKNLSLGPDVISLLYYELSWKLSNGFLTCLPEHFLSKCWECCSEVESWPSTHWGFRIHL